MKIAIASGKGGTGKTTVATNLAYLLSHSGNRVVYADCDVEEPNGHLFLKPDWTQTINVYVKNPRIDHNKCDFCGRCAEVCQFNALAVLADRVLVFPSLCHGCGGCFHICPQRAIEEIDRLVGIVKVGNGRGVITYEGRLNIGEALAPPIIGFLRKTIEPFDLAVIDAPPGTSCPVIEAVKNTDYVMLVTEPTPFGLNDLILAVNMIRKLNLPFGVIVNRMGVGDDRVHEYCQQENVEIIMEIPDDRRIAEQYSEGKLIIDALPDYAEHFKKLCRRLIPHKTAGV
ncbi:MAG: ATP-binding protein [candidate division Zixibacteria bacterium]|nr:ATP-binding protein [candidate division Zixibacteria bacterium]MDD5425786.1 ATP-binding protein [candidate division Zixibacteria bacterium]